MKKLILVLLLFFISVDAYAGDTKIFIPEGNELHVLGVRHMRANRNNIKSTKPIDVYVKRPNKPISLILMNDGGVTWNIITEHNADAADVHLSGRAKVTVNGKPNKNVNQFHYKRSITKIGDDSFRIFLAFIKEATGRESISSFNGGYSASSEGFTVDEDLSHTPEMSRKHLEFADSKKYPKMDVAIGAIHHPGTYDLSGKLLEKFPSIRSKRYGFSERLHPDPNPPMVFVPSENAYFSAHFKGLIKIDKENGEPEYITLDKSRYGMARDGDITYDSKNNRLVLLAKKPRASLFLFYDLDTKEWGALGAKGRMGFDTVSYDSYNDQYIASNGYPEAGYINLDILNSKGEHEDKVAIPVLEFQGIMDTYSRDGSVPIIKVTPYKNYYALFITGENGYSRHLSEKQYLRLYLYNKATKEVHLMWGNERHPRPPAL
jgi:hypothetical protein